MRGASSRIVNRSPTKLVQTRVPADLGAWIEREATVAGLSVAGWLRNRLLRLREELRLNPRGRR